MTHNTKKLIVIVLVITAVFLAGCTKEGTVTYKPSPAPIPAPTATISTEPLNTVTAGTANNTACPVCACKCDCTNEAVGGAAAGYIFRDFIGDD
jgi:hypothetical protein